VPRGGAKKDETIVIKRSELDALLTSMRRIQEGDLAARLDVKFDDPAMTELQVRINELVVTLDSHTEEFRESTMDLALGLSECFQVLASVSAGDLSARVSEETLGSTDELMVQLGGTLNETIANFEDQMQTIQQQQAAISHLVHQLQTPILQLWDDVLALPVIGMVDTKRSAEMMETLLSQIIKRQAKYVILDVTGVEIVDTKTADHFVKVMKSAELLGSRCILTGIRPAVAQTLVELGVNLSSISTLRNLQDGLRECLRHMEQERGGERALSAARK
jgi:anti-anti-sigma regulatory factor